MAVSPIESFDQYKGLLRSEDVIVLGFWHPMYIDCREMLFILSEEAQRAEVHKANLKFFRVQADEQEQISQDCGVVTKRLPVVIAFKKGKECGRVTGMKPLDIERMIRKLY
ncbi:hypothetical protein DL93DRAFT_2103156 [Clavulina sp. PMI_390]|nr:hypothetical protein DL93DRAFT_2103156 [Clavulina sp. PMI_390]